jgi:uncharacterized RDD family membrane protein YckC
MSTSARLLAPASIVSRFIAAMIDTMIVAAVFALVQGYLKFLPKDLPFEYQGKSLAPLVYYSMVHVLYYIFLQSAFGVTVGKRVMGLSLMNVASGEKLTIPSVLARETLGRLLSGIGFIGYIYALFNSDHRAVHDLISGSIVVSESASEESIIISLVKLFGLSSVTFSLLIGGGAYYLFYTVYPLRQAAKALELEGFKITGIKGNLAKGFSFGSLKFENDKMEILAEGIDYKYEDIFKMALRKEVRIRNVETAKIKITLRENFGPKLTGKEEPATAAEKTPPKSYVSRQEERIEALKEIPLILESINIRNLEITTAEGNNLKLNEFSLNQFEARNGVMTLEDMAFDSSYGVGSFKQLRVEKDLLSLTNGDFLIRQAPFSGTITRDLDFQLINVRLQPSTGNFSGHLLGLRNSLEISGDEQTLHLVTKDLQPHWFLKDAPPIYNLNIDLKGSPKKAMADSVVAGKYAIESQEFKVGQFLWRNGFLHGETLVSNRRIGATLMISEDASKNKHLSVSFESDQPFPLDEIVSEMLYKRSARALNNEERGFLAKEVMRFSMSPLTSVQAPAPLRMMPPRSGYNNYRAPANR